MAFPPNRGETSRRRLHCLDDYFAASIILDPDSRYGTGRARQHRPAWPRPPVGAQQLRKSGVSDRYGGRPPPLVAKFYRPGRWSDAAILEEHGFVQELVEREIPVVAAWAAADGKTLHQFDGFSFAVFPRHGGRSPELEDDATLEWLGCSLWRIHAVGGLRVYQQRPTLELDIASFGEEPSVFRWPTASSRRICWRPIAVPLAQRCWACAVASSVAGSVGALRLHGDCHGSNVLWTDARQHFVDFDDSRMGPGGTGSVDVVVQ